MPVHGSEWFAVLPDSAAAQDCAASLAARPGADVALRHASGRPCLIGAFTAGAPVCAVAGPVRVAVIGCCPVTAAGLERRAARLTGLGLADELVAGLPGSFHLVTAVDGEVRVRGDAAGMRRVFHTSVGASAVAADRADLLAVWHGSEVDLDRLMVRLLQSTSPVLSGSMWRNVHAVPPGYAADLPANGPVRLTRWWRPPEPVMDLWEAAPLVGRALAEAVACRTRAGETIAADLSGGLDSTPLCFLAQSAVQDGGGRLVTVRTGVDQADHDDEQWASKAARLLTGDHLVLAPGSVPGRYAGVAEPVTGLDEPLGVITTVRRDVAVAALLADHGARVHLTGHGGDEVTFVPPCHLHDLVRARPLSWWSRLREYRALARWPLAASLAALAEHRSYPGWLASQADLLTAPHPLRYRPELGWEGPMRLPSWAHPDVAAALGPMLRRAAADARPLAGRRAQHQIAAVIHDSAADLRQLQRLTARHGAAVHAPYLDTAVIDACLATRLDQRARPGAYKPLTVAAMAGRVPEQCLRRTTKGEFSSTLFEGLRRHRDQLVALADGSRLAALGLADETALRRACLRTPAQADPGGDLELFAAMENWLRALPAPDHERRP
ncbi:asparagine synthase-related protein [Nonomuraea sp. NPDC049709]|uniref:asparagine synthase-related protein n=1 Tax=Nonomuraea sp. NPDC049709 TaxID=3154736 RepID=UPI003424215B